MYSCDCLVYRYCVTIRPSRVTYRNANSSQTAHSTGLTHFDFNDALNKLEMAIPKHLKPCNVYDPSLVKLNTNQNNSLLMLNLNISSLQKHFDELLEFLKGCHQ